MAKLEEIYRKHIREDHNILTAMKEYAEFCCDQQKKICADNAELKYVGSKEDNDKIYTEEGYVKFPKQICTDYEGETRFIDKESILNSPTFKENESK